MSTITDNTTRTTDPASGSDRRVIQPEPKQEALSTRHWTGVDTANGWVKAARAMAPQLAERVDEHDRKGTFTHDGFGLLREHRFMSMLVPAELGGGGATHAEACAVQAELAHGCPSTSLSFSMHSHLVAAQVWRYHRGLPAPILTKIVNEQTVLVSTGASDWIDSSGAAVKVDGGFRVSARKMPASGCPGGDVLVTSVRYEDPIDGAQILHMSVPFAASGVSIEKSWDAMGMRGTGSDTVVLDDVFVPDSAVSLARPANEWHPIWNVVLGAALPLIMATYVGVAESAAERAAKLAERRANRPEVAPQVGRMLNRLTSARDTVKAMIEASDDLRFENTQEHAAASLTRKTNATEACIDTVRIAMEAGGGPAFGRGNGVERLFRDIHGSLYHPLPTAQQERFTGRLALNLNPLENT